MNTNKPMNSTRKRVLLIDGDILIYQACLACQKETYINDILEPVPKYLEHCLVENFIMDMSGADIVLPWSSLSDVIASMNDTLAKYERLLDADEVVIAISCPGKDNFRKTVLPSYKANRKGQKKPICYKPALSSLKASYDIVEMPTLEADDVLGIIATAEQPEGANVEYVIISIDKDLEQIPGLLYNPNKDYNRVTGKATIRTITEADANLKFWEQALTGDTVDNYKGCPKMGPVTALKHLNKDLTEEEAWSIIKGLYEKAKVPFNEMMQQIRVAKILQAKDWDFDKDCVKPFNLPLSV